MLWLLLALASVAPGSSPVSVPSMATVVLRCTVTGDAHDRVYELRRRGEDDATRWEVAMRGRETGAAEVVLPLPGARPVVARDTVTLEYQTQNGGRDIWWRVTPDGVTLDLHANFELEVNIEPDLDPRVELMNTEGPLSQLACAIPADR